MSSSNNESKYIYTPNFDINKEKKSGSEKVRKHPDNKSILFAYLKLALSFLFNLSSNILL